MSRLRTRNRSALAAATLLIVALAAGLSGCVGAEEDPLPVPTKATAQTPEPTVTLTPIPSSSTTPGEDPEADVAAAIETYEAYIEATNLYVVADESTWQPIFELTTGEALAVNEKQFDEQKDSGNQIAGEAEIQLIRERQVGPEEVQLDVCLDVSQVDATDSNGNSLVDPNRPPVQPFVVTLIPLTGELSASRWLISDIDFRTGEPIC